MGENGDFSTKPAEMESCDYEQGDWIDRLNWQAHGYSNTDDGDESTDGLPLTRIYERNTPHMFNPLMLDSDIALAYYHYDIVKEFGNDLRAWREEFDKAFIHMSEIGLERATMPNNPSEEKIWLKE